MLYAGIYLGGMVLGFFVSALTKGKLWDGNDDKPIPVVMTFFWPMAVVFFVGIHLVYLFVEFPRLFFWLLNKTANGIDGIRNYKFNSTRKRIVVPVPSIKQNYRVPGAHPCIACGTPTSIDQSNMECLEMESVESAEDRSFRLEVG